MKAEIGIIGGSGFYELASGLKEFKVETPYGSPSGKVAIGKIANHQIAFLPRHGRNHQLPPHKINYRANLWALKKLGVERILSVTACGSLQKEIKRGDFVVLDQFVDRTRGRADTFYDGPETIHISTAYPYCPELSKLAYASAKKLKIPVHPKGTVVVIQGPRFSTKAESEWFTKMGWDVINMTGYPEVVLARELEMCYCAIALATDYDVGIVVSEKLPPVSTEEIIKV
ncbi:S-methyl-5'-thioadenosine phosphorylase, partial [Candidatus Gottesmanbacteria bacterium]|nr:S-methyl-5'-thioadenosine phosphorylase [Candidatus Gottesmanbacteria bacterium]